MKTDPPSLPTSASTGLDAEVRQFMSRLMLGYEAAHRQVTDMSLLLAKRAEQAEEMVARSLKLQMQIAEEREDLISQRHKRELESAAAKQRADAHALIGREIKALLPLVGKKLLGVPLTGNDSHGLQDLLASMSSEQIESVMSTGKLEFSMAQRELLASTLSSLAEREQKQLEPALPESAFLSEKETAAE